MSNLLRRSTYQSDTGISIDVPKIVTSVLVAPAIYAASYTSLRLWNALQAYDALNPPKPIEASVSKKRRRFVALGIVFGIIAAETLGTFALLSVSETVLEYIIQVLLVPFFWAGFRSLVLSAVDIEWTVARRIPKCNKVISRLIVRPSAASKRRSRFASFAALPAAIYSVIFPSPVLIGLVVFGLCYAIVSKPGMRSPSGWTSVRGVLISIYGISTLIVSLAVALVWAFSSRKESPATPKDAEPSGKFDKILSMEHHLYNIIAGTVIALVLRYEYVHHSSNMGSSVFAGEAEPLMEKENVQKNDDILSESGIPVSIARTISYFPAPLFHTSLVTFVLCHLPALVLALPHCHHLYQDAADSKGIFIFFAVMPPQLLTFFFVPIVVGLAALVRSDGNELWRYAEQWDIKLPLVEAAASAAVQESAADVKA